MLYRWKKIIFSKLNIFSAKFAIFSFYKLQYFLESSPGVSDSLSLRQGIEKWNEQFESHFICHNGVPLWLLSPAIRLEQRREGCIYLVWKRYQPKPTKQGYWTKGIRTCTTTTWKGSGWAQHQHETDPDGHSINMKRIRNCTASTWKGSGWAQHQQHQEGFVHTVYCSLTFLKNTKIRFFDSFSRTLSIEFCM